MRVLSRAKLGTENLVPGSNKRYHLVASGVSYAEGGRLQKFPAMIPSPWLELSGDRWHAT